MGNQEIYHSHCNICAGAFLPEVTGDLFTCDACLLALSCNMKYKTIIDQPLLGKIWHYLSMPIAYQ